MTTKREKRPSRLAWFALDADAFLEDARMQTLTAKEKAAWALMLIRGFRNKGTIITEPTVVAEQTGLSNKEARTLLAKLFTNQLLVTTDKVFEAISHRLQKEYIHAQEAYDRYRLMGINSADKHGTANLKQ